MFASAFLLAAMGSAAADQRAIFKLVVNEVPKADIVAVIRPNDLLLPVKDLEDAGIKGFSGKRQIIGGRVFVSLASLTPGIKYEIDLKSVSLKLTSETSLLGSRDISLRHLGTETAVFSANPSLFVNYGLNMDQQLKPPGASIEAGLSLFGNALLDSTASVENNGTILPGLTNLTVDDRSTMRELIVGDTFVFPSLSLLAGSATVGGITLRSDFQLDPYFISLPQGSLSGTATTPSTAKVYVNGVLVKTIDLQPGVFTLHDIPNPIGTGNTQVVVQNAFGQQQVFSSSYDIAGSALAPGVNNYAATAGLVRSQGGSSISYGQPALSGFWRHGWLTWLTPLVRIEADRDVLSGGGGFTTAIGRSGLTLEGSLSRGLLEPTTTSTPTNETGDATSESTQNPVSTGPSRPVTGYASAAQYYLQLDGLTASLQAIYQSSRYSNLSITPAADRSTFQLGLGASYPLTRRTTLTSEFAYSKDRDDGDRFSVDLQSNIRLTESLVSFVTADLAGGDSGSTTESVSFGLSYAFGQNKVVTTTAGYTEGAGSNSGPNYGIVYSDSASSGPGFGYSLQAEKAPNLTQELADLTYHGYHSTSELDLSVANGQQTASLTVAGSITALGGRLLAAPPITNAFALLRVPGVPNVETYLYNQPAGRTDANGDLLISRLVTANTGNQFSINYQDVPVSYLIDTTKEVVAPPNRGGAVVIFPVRKVRSIVGKLRVQLAGRVIIPSFGTLTVTAHDKKFESPVGGDGTFFLDSPPPGRLPATIDFDQGTCSFTIDIQDSDQSFIKLGTLSCAM
jgi:outer membrane usher protein